MINRTPRYQEKLPASVERVDLMPEKENEQSDSRGDTEDSAKTLTWNPFDENNINEEAGGGHRQLPREDDPIAHRWVKLTIIGLAALLMCLLALTMESPIREKASSFFFPADRTPAALIPMESPDVV
jgi:hypothetical protein